MSFRLMIVCVECLCNALNSNVDHIIILTDTLMVSKYSYYYKFK